MENLNDIFSVNAATLITDSKTDGVFYMPSADKGTDKVYNSQIKFIANVHNPAKPIIRKWVVWLKNPDTEKMLGVDDPDTVGQPSLVKDAWSMLYNSPSAYDKELSKKFGRRETFYALVYIVKDEHQPQLEGKIKVLKFGKQLWDVLEASAKDADEPNNFLDIFNGKTLRLKVIEKAGNNNYQLSSFGNKVNYVKIDGEDMVDTPKNRKKLAAWLLENSPDISEYDFKPWDEATRKFVVDAIKAIIPNEAMVSKIFKSAGISNTKSKKVETEQEELISKSKKSKIEIDEDEEEIKPKKSSKKIVIEDEDDEEIFQPKKSSKKIVIEEDEDDEDEDDKEINLDDIDDDELDEIDAQIGIVNKRASKKIVSYEDDEDDED